MENSFRDGIINYGHHKQNYFIQSVSYDEIKNMLLRR